MDIRTKQFLTFLTLAITFVGMVYGATVIGPSGISSTSDGNFSRVFVNGTDINDLIGTSYPQQPASYIIWRDGVTYYAKNGNTGSIDYSGTSASTVINNAITNTPTNGLILLAPGQYSLTARLQGKSAVNIRGSGMYTTIIQAASTFNSPAEDSILSLAFDSRIQISDITFDGSLRTVGKANCISISESINITLLNLRLIGFGSEGNGVSVRNCSNVYIDNMLVSGLKGASYQAVAFNNVSKITVNNVIAQNLAYMGFDIHGCTEVNLNNILIKDAVFGGKILGDSDRYSQECNLNNIIFTDISTDRGFFVGDYVKNINVNGLIISGGTHGVYVDDLVEGVILNNIKIRDNSLNGIQLNADNVILSNFMINNSGAYSLHISGDYLDISNGYIKNSQSSGIYMTDSQYSTLNNLFVNYSAVYGIDWQTSNYTKVIGCTFLNTVNRGMQINAASHYGTIADSKIMNGANRGVSFAAITNLGWDIHLSPFV